MVLKLQSAFYYFISHRALSFAQHPHCRCHHHFGPLDIALYFICTQSGMAKRASFLLLFCVSLFSCTSRLWGQESKLRFFLSPIHLGSHSRRVCLPDCMRCLYAQQWSILIRFPGTTLCTCIAYHRHIRLLPQIFIWCSRRMEQN